MGTAALRLHHFIRFSAFVHDDAAMQAMRTFAAQLAKIFHQDKAIYAPCEGIGDEIAGWVTEGLRIADIETRLQQRGPPARSIGELATRMFPDVRYFVEAF